MFSILLITYQAGIHEGEFLRAEEHIVHGLHTYSQAAVVIMSITRRKRKRKGRQEGRKNEMKEGMIEVGMKIGEQKRRK